MRSILSIGQLQACLFQNEISNRLNQVNKTLMHPAFPCTKGRFPISDGLQRCNLIFALSGAAKSFAE